MKRRNLLTTASSYAALMGFGKLSFASASTPITIIFPFSPGASGDVNIRLITRTITEETGQNFVIDNRPGANSIIGAEISKKASPNGKTLFVANVGSHAINESLYGSQLTYDAQKDFEPITTLWEFPCVLAVPKDSKATSVSDLIELSKNNPRGLSYASAGAGSGGHLLGEMLAKSTGGNFVHIPYKGAAPAVNDLMGGLVDLFFVSYGSVRAQVESGNLRILAVAAKTRLQAIPDIPTLMEKGIHNVFMSNWFGLVAPAKTPQKTINDLQAMFSKAAKKDSVRERLKADGIEAISSTPEDFKKLMAEDTKRFAALIGSMNIKKD